MTLFCQSARGMPRFGDENHDILFLVLFIYSNFMKAMSMKDSHVHCTGRMMHKFLGVLMLGIGAYMLGHYTVTVNYMMGVGGKVDLGSLMPVANFISQIVAYTWPIVATLIGLSYLACFKRCLATCVFMCYLVIFATVHMWTGDMTGAIWDVLIALFVSVMKGVKSLEMMCEMKK